MQGKKQIFRIEDFKFCFKKKSVVLVQKIGIIYMSNLEPN